jgi:hypothetical protein
MPPPGLPAPGRWHAMRPVGRLLRVCSQIVGASEGIN